MTNNEVWVILTTTFRQILSEYQTLNDVVFRRSYQPRQQGTFSRDALYCFDIESHRYGFQSRSSSINEESQLFDVVESQFIETTYQVSSQVDENPASTTAITALDIVTTVAMALNSVRYISLLGDLGIGIIRITDIRRPYFINEYSRFEADPSFDFIINYEQKLVNTEQGVAKFEPTFFRI